MWIKTSLIITIMFAALSFTGCGELSVEETAEAESALSQSDPDCELFGSCGGGEPQDQEHAQKVHECTEDFKYCIKACVPLSQPENAECLKECKDDKKLCLGY
jgi:hypothetical protein